MKHLIIKNCLAAAILLSAISHSSLFAQVWTAQNSRSSRDFNSLFFVNDSTGWALGKGNGGSSQGNLRMTTDKGLNWNSSKLNLSNSEIHGSFFFNERSGIAVGEHSSGDRAGLIIRTTDGGQSWSADISSFEEALLDVHFQGANGWLVGEEGIMACSRDSGASWQKLSIPQLKSDEPELFAVSMADTSRIMVVGEKGTTIRSNDGGQFWQTVIVPTDEDLKDVFFSTSNTAWTVGNKGVILKSIDGGLSWNKQSWNGDRDLTAVYFINDSTGWISGKYGTVLKTTNGGIDWVSEYSGTSQHIRDIFMLSDSLGWFCGYDGMIHVYQALGTSLAHTNSVSLSLGPNPCYSGSVSIKIENMEAVMGEVKLFGLDGQLWKKLKLEYSNEISLDLRMLPSGLYLLSFQTNDEVKVFRKLFIYNN